MIVDKEELMTSLKTPTRILSITLISSLLLIACSDTKDQSSKQAKESNDPSSELQEQLKAKPIKTFSSTVHDAQDIALLKEYELNFNSLSTDLENELIQLKKDGNLTEEMNSQRKRDLIQSSLNMLKDLDLKTEQGRYIQGLYYQYWESQTQVYEELTQSNDGELQNPTDTLKNMSDYYTAQAQLEHWSSVTP